MLKNNENERKILDLPFNMFTTSTLTSHGVFHNAKRDGIHVNELLANLESKKMIKSGYYLKSKGRNIEGFLRSLPDVTNETQFLEFSTTLVQDYGYTLEKYLRTYESNKKHPENLKSTLTDTAVTELLKQETFIPLIKEEIRRIKEARAQITVTVSGEVHTTIDAVLQSGIVVLNSGVNDQRLMDNNNTDVLEEQHDSCDYATQEALKLLKTASATVEEIVRMEIDNNTDLSINDQEDDMFNDRGHRKSITDLLDIWNNDLALNFEQKVDMPLLQIDLENI
ncbi:unnamed protein product, partial [Didymodactylos carnosus]